MPTLNCDVCSEKCVESIIVYNHIEVPPELKEKGFLSCTIAQPAIVSEKCVTGNYKLKHKKLLLTGLHNFYYFNQYNEKYEHFRSMDRHREVDENGDEYFYYETC